MRQNKEEIQKQKNTPQEQPTKEMERRTTKLAKKKSTNKKGTATK